MEEYGKVSLQSKAKDKIVKILMSWVGGKVASCSVLYFPAYYCGSFEGRAA